MSAPDTNIDKQKRRHIGPLAGIFGGLALAGIMFLVWLFWVVSAADEPEEANVVPGAPVVETDEGPVEGSSATIVD